MTTQKRKWVLIGFLIVVLVGWAMGQFDYARLVAGKRPVFARVKLHCMDGGSVEYWGLGYVVTDMHQFAGEMSPAKPMTYRAGPTLDYWTPFASRDSTRFITGTNR